LKVVHPAWAQELFLLSNILKQKINTCLGANRITTIRFVTSDIKTNKPTLRQSYLVERHQRPYTEHNTHLTNKEAGIIANLKDEELKQVLEIFFRRCKYIKESK
jgi:hypothetical protein